MVMGYLFNLLIKIGKVRLLFGNPFFYKSFESFTVNIPIKYKSFI